MGEAKKMYEQQVLQGRYEELDDRIIRARIYGEDEDLTTALKIRRDEVLMLSRRFDVYIDQHRGRSTAEADRDDPIQGSDLYAEGLQELLRRRA